MVSPLALLRWRSSCGRSSHYTRISNIPRCVLIGCICFSLRTQVLHRAPRFILASLAFATRSSCNRLTSKPLVESSVASCCLHPGPQGKIQRRTSLKDATNVAEANEKLHELEDYVKYSNTDLDSYPVPYFLKNFRSDGNINVAVTGASGVGKSSFVNSLRRVKAADPSAARTGILETTMAPAQFSCSTEQQGIFSCLARTDGNFDAPEKELQVRDLLLHNRHHIGLVNQGKLSKCTMWDLPGTGTEAFPQATYTRSMGIRHFNLVVLLTATRFTEADVLLMHELRRWNVPFFLVRTKIDLDIESAIEQEQVLTGEDIQIQDCGRIGEDTISVIKQYVTKMYQEKVYCISSKRRFRDKYDFLTLEADMADRIKIQCAA